MGRGDPRVRLEFSSSLDMLDVVAVLSDQVGRLVGLDEDAVHWVNMAVRESVINAVQHGNRGDLSKRVFVEFMSSRGPGPESLTVRVRDEGEGFDPERVADPLAAENVLKSRGRAGSCPCAARGRDSGWGAASTWRRCTTGAGASCSPPSAVAARSCTGGRS